MRRAARAAIRRTESGCDADARDGDRRAGAAFLLRIVRNQENTFDLCGGIAEKIIDVPVFARAAADVSQDARPQYARGPPGVDVLALRKPEAAQPPDFQVYGDFQAKEDLIGSAIRPARERRHEKGRTRGTGMGR